MNRKPTKTRLTLPVAAALVAALFAPLAAAQFDTGITYQGELKSGGAPKTGTVDLRFDQFLAETGGTTPFDPVIVDGVVLDQGRFTVQLPFPPSTFANGQIFIEVGVREDAAGGPADLTGFTSLLPRQKVTPTPYALIARKVLDNAVAGSSIVNESVTGSDIADGTITAADVNTTSTVFGVQRRVTGPCAAGQVLNNIGATGTPGCIGAVLSISTPPGSGIASSLIAGGVVSLSLNSNEGQDRVAGECEAGQAAISAVNPDGSVQCVYVGPATANAPVVLDSVGDVGSHLSARRSNSGLVGVQVAYYDNTNNRLKFLHCADLNCSTATIVIIDDPAVNDVGQFASHSVISGAAIAYYDATAGDLKLALCGNFNCTSGTITIRTIDSTGDVGRFAEIMNVGGRVGIAYHDSSSNGYKFALCNDALCTAPTITSLTGLTGGGLFFSDIAATRIDTVAPPRFVLISQGSAVVLVNCGNNACSTFTTEVVSDTTDIGPPLAMTTIRLGGVDRHWVSYGRPAAGAGRIFHCTDAACATSSIVGGQSLNGTQSHAALVARDQGTPLHLQTDASSAQVGVRVFSTSNVTSSAGRLSGATATGGDVDATAISGGGASIFYYDTVNDNLVYLRCVRNDCSEL